jgi:hypothetical protein
MADKLFRDYFNEKVTDTVLPANAKVLIQDGTGEPTQINAGSIGAGKLVKVTENGKTGYRLKDADPANYGNIGDDAVDLSFQIEESTTKGATGNNSHAQGADTTASGDISHAEGNATTASGRASHAQGNQTLARSFAEHSGGTFGTDYTPQSATVFDPTDRLVNYGNGTGSFDRSDAYTLFKNGMQKFFTAALSTITNAVKGSVMLDENARLNIHDGTAFNAVPFSSEVATAAQGVKADNSVQLTGAQTVAGVKTFSNNIIANVNVGIGTTFINAKLTVEGTGFFGNNVYNLSQSRDLFISGGRRDPGDAAGFLLRSAQVANLGSTFNILVANGVAGGGANYGQYTDGASRLFIATNGNVSIGNTNPTEKLDVVGNGKFSGTVSCGQFTTATEPAYVKGAQFFNTTLNKIRIGGATAYETVTSS